MWLELILTAHDLIYWTQVLTLDGALTEEKPPSPPPSHGSPPEADAQQTEEDES